LKVSSVRLFMREREGSRGVVER